jgi:hypothetical protein
MLAIHNRGDLLIPLETYELAQKVSSAISIEAKRDDYNLVYRAVDTQQTHPAVAKKAAQLLVSLSLTGNKQ